MKTSILKPEDFNDLILIDEFHLVEECVRAGEIYRIISEESVKAISKRDELEVILARLEAQLYIEFKEKADKDGEKVTENLLKNKITVDNKVQALKEKILEAEYLVSNWNSQLKSFSKKGDMIRSLVDYYNTNKYQELNIKGTKKEYENIRYNQIKEKLKKGVKA